jgi:hypothetical protein
MTTLIPSRTKPATAEEVDITFEGIAATLSHRKPEISKGLWARSVGETL